MKRTILLIVTWILFIAGVGTFSYPRIERIVYEQKTDKLIESYMSKYKSVDIDTMYQAMQEYNKNLYETRQVGLSDAFAYQKPVFDLKAWGIEDALVGYIEISALNVKIPIYLGATQSNLKKGVAQLSYTSIPIGGKNTNCVLAGHRGFHGAPMFEKIQNLKVGDNVYVTNFLETLHYQVTGTKIILPDHTNEILIQKNEDMITLITCHPPRYNFQRYVVYCKRVS